MGNRRQIASRFGIETKTALCEGGTMHRELRGVTFLAMTAALALTGGCSFSKVPQGWMLSSGWSLEFHRQPCGASTAASAHQCEIAPAASESTDSPHSDPALTEPAPAPVLHKADDGPVAESDRAGVAGLLKRRGRLGICESCGKLGRFADPSPPPTPTAPVIAKFHPVPAAPAFCPQGSARAVAFDTAPSQKSPSSSGVAPGSRQKNKATPRTPTPEFAPPVLPQPEVIPPPPANARATEPRELDAPPEPPDWVFTPDAETRDGGVVANNHSPKRQSADANSRR
jgi:hypothetical protein